MKYQINPSILSANLAYLASDINVILNAGANNIHFDVMDNHYVPNLSFGPILLKALIRSGIKVKIDVHLMVEPVDELIQQFGDLGVSSIVFHPDASRNVEYSLDLIKSFQIDSGIALNPSEEISSYKNIIEKIDRVLIMTVNPGFGGQKFIEKMFSKISKVSNFLKEFNRKILIEVDGGINIDNIAKVASYGAEAFVVGSSIFNSSNYAETIRIMFDRLNKLAY
jgi:ribulose-phosphate 3-epimerase